MTRRRVLTLSCALATALAAGPALAQLPVVIDSSSPGQSPVVGLPADLAPELAPVTVEGLPTAPLLQPLPVVQRAVREGSPGPNRLRAFSHKGMILRGFEGFDRLIGGPGPDELWGGTAPDRLSGRGGDDLIMGETGAEVMTGGAGNDRIFGDYGIDRLDGGPGNDVLDGGSAPDYIDGGPGDDLIHGGTAHDWIWGGPGDDVIYTDRSGDEVKAGPGDDVVYTNNGSAMGPVDCGAGDDTLVIMPYDEPGGWSARDRIRDGVVVGCERIIEASPRVDPAAGVIYSAPMDEGVTYRGTERDDKLNGGHGDDRLYGLGGDDHLWADQFIDPVTAGYDARDLVDGGAGDDDIYGGRGSNTLLGGPGDDFLRGGETRNVMKGGSGDDEIRVWEGTNRIWGGPGNDTIHATSKDARVTIDCGPGRDVVNYGITRPSVRNCEQVVSRL